MDKENTLCGYRIMPTAKKIKCNFTVATDTKKTLDELKRVTGFSVGSLVDLLVATQGEELLKILRKEKNRVISPDVTD